MTSTSDDLGPSWLASVPAGATVLRRDVREYVVSTVGSDHVAARVPGGRRQRSFDLTLVAPDERELLRPGARFWVVTERWTVEWGTETSSAIRVKRRGVATAEQAFARTAGGAR